ncbi:MAG: chromosome partition protein MukE [Myxococcota bacterium]
MTASGFQSLEDVIADEHFPEVDLALRRGRHIGSDDGAVYEYLVDALDHLEPFYRRFGAELVLRSDEYIYLLPLRDSLGRRQLSPGEMLVGQTLALMFLDPATVADSGIVRQDDLLRRLSEILGTDTLVRTLRPQKRKIDERTSGEIARTGVAKAARMLADLGFVDAIDERRLRLRPALMRFADPVHDLSDQQEALERLVRRGEVRLEVGEDTNGANTNDEDANGEDASGESSRTDGDDEAVGG